MNRRDFFKKNTHSFIKISLYQSFLSNILSCSNSLNKSSYNLVTVFFPGAPSRWGYDLFLNPYNQKGVDLNLNKGMANSYRAKNGRYIESEYILKQDKDFGFYLPPIWQCDIPTNFDGYTNANGVLKNLISIQGIDMENGAHFVCQKKIFNAGGEQSLHGLASDTSSLPIDSFNLYPQRDFFKSKYGKKRLKIFDTSNNELFLLKSFTSSFENKSLRLSKNYRDIVKIEKRYNQFHQDKVNYDLRDRLERLEQIFAKVDLDKLWKNKIYKYKKLIKRSMTIALIEGALPGVCDLPIGHLGKRRQEYSFGGQNIGQNHRDLRSMFDSELSHPDRMAEHFTFAEIILELEISNNIVISPGEFIFLKNTNEVCKRSITHSFDEHRYGIMNIVLINSLYNYALMSCLNEFIANLKVREQFNNTIISVASEFNRSPRSSADGSDHGWNAASVSLYSGLVKDGPIFIGNLEKEREGLYMGFWGKGSSENTLLNGKKISKIKIQNVHSTIATALCVDSPYPNHPSLIRKDDKKKSLVTTLEKTKIIT